MEVVALENNLTEVYREFLRLEPNGLLYYSLEYRALLHRVIPELKSDYFVVTEKNKILGVLPVFSYKTYLGTVINSSPFFGSYGGILSSNLAAQKMLLERYRAILESPDLASATIISNPLEDEPVDYPFSEKIKRICQITDISMLNSEEAIFETVDSSTRRNIKKAKSSSLSVEIDNNAHQSLAELHWQNMMLIGGATKPQVFFDAIAKEFKPDEQYKIFVARFKDSVIGALLLFYCNETVEYFTPATNAEHRNLQPSALLISQAIQDASCRGYKYWNWGGTWDTQEGVYKFKKKWGAKDWHYQYYFKLKNPELAKLSKQEILKLAPYFYVLPYTYLKG